ncbi:hypothetical protein ACFQ2H_34890 [Streptomyces violaceoruber]
MTHSRRSPTLWARTPPQHAGCWPACSISCAPGGLGHDLLQKRLDAKTEAELVEAGATMGVGQSITGYGETSVRVPGANPLAMSYKGAAGRLVRTAFPSVTSSDAIERGVRKAVDLLAEHDLLKGAQVGSGRQRVVLRQVPPGRGN